MFGLSVTGSYGVILCGKTIITDVYQPSNNLSSTPALNKITGREISVMQAQKFLTLPTKRPLKIFEYKMTQNYAQDPQSERGLQSKFLTNQLILL